MLKRTLVFALLVISVLSQKPDPPRPGVWPTEFSSWLVTSVVEEGKTALIKDKGQIIVFSLSKQYTCRYNEQDLLSKVKARPTDMCDYKNGFHWSINDTTQFAVCDGNAPLTESTLKPIVWPPEFLAQAKYYGTDPVANLNCSHWVANSVSINGQTIQMDVWVDIENGFPCQISIFELGTKIHTTWAFVGFVDEIPPETKVCTAPKVVCAEADWKCEAKEGEDNDDLGAALQWVCDPQHLDCTPINPGGTFFEPNTVLAHANWAFSSYYEKHKAEQGEYACDFGGTGRLIPPSTSKLVKKYKKRESTSVLDHINAFADDIVCPDLKP